jgi:molybdate transport system substrate-binding protein
VPESRVDLAWSRIAMAVRAGAPKPDISTVDKFKHALLAAKSIAYSIRQAASISRPICSAHRGLRPDQGQGTQDPGRTGRQGGCARRSRDRLPAGERAAPVPGIDIVGPIPAELQVVNVFAGGLAVGAKQPEAGKALLTFLVSPAAKPVITESGMEFVEK